ncbi:hypothetical protein [Fibrivirga algicola]|uniref:HK97 gp10 family phage protein n=1 Tax=Fibrivirga algicola TaxID=2950420 RepID=A0ABX0QAU1_9BACT|nr:hypothetical protein [Fibrivirga algicola]NID09400.1 hypothetical protein [Fibrivirga algicola]
MYKIETNAERVLQRLMATISGAENDLQENLAEAAHDALALIAHRIQQNGKGQNGQALRTKSAKRLGAYSRGYGKKRTERGRQTDRVDFTNSGDMFNEWKVLSSEPRQATGGFATQEAADRAEYLEAYFGPSFGPSNDEREAVTDGFKDRLHVKLKQ